MQIFVIDFAFLSKKTLPVLTDGQCQILRNSITIYRCSRIGFFALFVFRFGLPPVEVVSQFDTYIDKAHLLCPRFCR